MYGRELSQRRDRFHLHRRAHPPAHARALCAPFPSPLRKRPSTSGLTKKSRPPSWAPTIAGPTAPNADVGQVFPEVVWHAEAPSCAPRPRQCTCSPKLVRENGIKVVLTGEGADEFLGGYNIFKEDKVRRFWARQPESSLRPLLLRRLYPYVADLLAVATPTWPPSSAGA